MKKYVDDSYETYEGKISEFLDAKPKRSRRMIFAAAASLVLVAGLFLGVTAQGRALVLTGTAIVVKSFQGAIGIPATNSVVRDVADADVADLGVSDVVTSSFSDADTSDTGDVTADGNPFPSVLPPAPAKKKTTATKKSQSVSVSAANDAPASSAAGTVSIGAPFAPVMMPLASQATIESKPLAAVTSPSASVYVVAVTLQGNGRGVVTSTPSGILCDGTGICAWSFPGGSKVVLHATHDTASSFDGWSGACSGTTAACTIVLGGDVSAVASFHAKPVASSTSAASSAVTVSSATAASTVTPSFSPSEVSAASSSDDNSSDASVPSEPVSSEDGTNSVVSSDTSASAATVGHVVIATVQIAGTAASNDFVQLYNPTASAIDISGWKLRKKSSTGTDYSLKVFGSGASIAAGGYFTWANSTGGFSDSIDADVASTQTLAAGNSVGLLDATGAEVDAVAWGNGTDQYGEGGPYPSDPGVSQVLARRFADGGVVDTDDNANDFTVQ